MRKVIALITVVISVLFLLSGCSNNISEETEHDSADVSEDTKETDNSDEDVRSVKEGYVLFTDDCSRTVEIPEEITKIAPSGNTAQMILMTISPDKLVGLANMPDEDQREYLPDEIDDLPVFGQFYGGKGTGNLEELVSVAPQVIFDLGDYREGIEKDIDLIEEQTGIPVVFIDTSLDNMADAYRKIGEILNVTEITEKQAEFIEESVEFAAKNSAKVTDKKTVMYGTGPDGLQVNAKGSSQADVIELIGAENAIVVENVSGKNGGNTVSLEEVYAVDPDVIILTDEEPYERILALDKKELSSGLMEWSGLSAVKNHRVYLVPDLPYNLLSMPPSVNRILGIWWLGQIVYPEIYNEYIYAEKQQEFYKLFWYYDLVLEKK